MNHIFVQIASYRDPELIPTIKHCLDRAKYPENLSFGICWQHSKEDAWDTLEEFSQDPRFRIIDIDYSDSKGACWARSQSQKLWRGEKYTLQLDSHHRFVQDWDEQIVQIWQSLEDHKALITGYPPNYNPGAPEDQWYSVPQICNIYRFNGKYVESRPADMPDWKDKNKPRKGVYISAGFTFGPGEINATVPYDPDMYFSGEECAMALRYYTNGYNIYDSHIVIVHHYYQRLECKKHWGDNQEWFAYDRVAHERLDNLIGYSEGIDLGVYGLGKQRTLEEYKNYSGIDFDRKLVHSDTSNGVEPPCCNSEIGWDNEMVRYSETLTWDYSKIEKCDDMRFWAMIVLDQDGIAIHREDLPYESNKEILNGAVCHKLFTFDRSKNRQIPTQLLIWPYSESKTWIDSSYQPILKD